MLIYWPIPFFVILAVAAFERGGGISAGLAFVTAVLSAGGYLSMRGGRKRKWFLFLSFIVYCGLRLFNI